MKRNIFFILLFIITSSLFAGLPHTVYVEVSLNSQNDHPQSLTFNAWIVGRETEILTETSGGCGYLAEEGLLYVQAGTFPTQWSAGETIHIEATAQEGGSGIGEFELTNNGGDFFGPTNFGSAGINLYLVKQITIDSKVKFKTPAVKNVKSFEWDFNNDGKIDSTEKNPEFAFKKSGNYKVWLTMKFNNGKKVKSMMGNFIVK